MREISEVKKLLPQPRQFDRVYHFVAKYSDTHGVERSVKVVGYRAGPFAIAETIDVKGRLEKVIQVPRKTGGSDISGGRWRVYHIPTGLWATYHKFDTLKLAKKVALEVEMCCKKDIWNFVPDPDDLKGQAEFANSIVCRFNTWKPPNTIVLLHTVFSIVILANSPDDTPARAEAIRKVDYMLKRQREARINANS